jgi:hypothetical protein
MSHKHTEPSEETKDQMRATVAAILKNKVVWDTIKRLNYLGHWSNEGVQKIEAILWKSEGYQKFIIDITQECMEHGFNTGAKAEPTAKDVQEAELEIAGKLRAIGGSLYTMGILVGFYAALAKLEAEEKAEKEKP